MAITQEDEIIEMSRAMKNLKKSKENERKQLKSGVRTWRKLSNGTLVLTSIKLSDQELEKKYFGEKNKCSVKN